MSNATVSSVAVRASARKATGESGSTPRPEGEKAAGHGVSDAEESPAALANPGHTATPTSPAPSSTPTADARTPTEEAEAFDIVRASCRLVLLDRPDRKRPGETLVSLAFALGSSRCGHEADQALHRLRDTGEVEAAQQLAHALGEVLRQIPLKPGRLRVAKRLEQRASRRGPWLRQQLHELAGGLRDLTDAELLELIVRLAEPPPPDSYATLRQQLYETRRAAARAANACVRALWLAEGAALDRWRQDHPEERFTAQQWPDLTNSKNEGAINLYQLVRRLSPELSAGAVAAQVSHTVAQKWKQVRWKALVQEECSPPHYRNTATLHVRAQEVKITPSDQGGVLLSFPLREGRDQRHTVHIEPRDEHSTFLLGQIASGAWKHGTISIEEDSRRRGRWFVRIAYKRRIVAEKAVRYCAINRGLRNFLVAVTDTGATYTERGDDIEATLKSFQKQRRGYQAQSHGSNRWGHGRVRTLKPIERLLAKGERWRATRNQTLARQFGRFCVEQGVGMVFVEDFSGIRAGEPPAGNDWIWQRIQEWPCYQLQTRIQSVLQELGIEYKLVQPQYISQQCPACGATDPDHRDLKRWRLACSACDYNRDLDVAAAANVRRSPRTRRRAAPGSGRSSGRRGRGRRAAGGGDG